jgi:hypothetical protein
MTSDVPGVVPCVICGCPIQRLEKGNAYGKPPTLTQAMAQHTKVVHPEYLEGIE